MKYIFVFAALLCASTFLPGQQMPLFNTQLLHQDFTNPGSFPDADVHSIRMGHTHREVQVAGWNSSAQYIRFQSRPMVFSDRFSWGVTATNDQIHTDQRIGFSPSMSVAVLKTSTMRASVGISAGMLIFQSNYGGRNIYNRNDPRLSQNTSSVQIDAGMGGQFAYSENKVRAHAGVAFQQLPGQFLDSESFTMRPVPHWTGELTAMYSPLYNLYVGPRLFYRDVYGVEVDENGVETPREFGGGQMDIGLTAQLARQDIWITAAYRTTNSALTTGFGMQLMGSDTAANPYDPANFLKMNASFSYPLQSGAGPAVELGLQWQFNQPRKVEVIDTLRWARPFWKTETWMTAHEEEFLAPNAPLELQAFQQVSGRNVYLSYEFPDMSLLYKGEDFYLSDTLVRHIGMEWEGMDGLMQGLVNESIREALTPDTARIRDKENLEPLQNLSWVEFYAFLRTDEQMAGFCSDVVYEGGLAGEMVSGDTLRMDVVVDDKDTTLMVVEGRCMTYLELAALKLTVMRSRFHYTFQERYAGDFRFVYEGSYIDPFDPDNRPPIRCKKPRIVTNHPHMQVFQTNYIDMKFRRYEKYLEAGNGQWTPRVPKELREAQIDRRVSGEE